MAELKVLLLGPGVLMLGDQAMRLHSAKALALLAFLAVESNRAHARDRLAGLLWGSGTDAAARQSLRQALYSLKAVADGKLSACLRSEQELLRFERGPQVEVDVHTFVAGANGAGPQEWAAAAAAYRAPLLEGRAFEECEEFMAWLRATRKTLHVLAARNRERLERELQAAAAAGGDAREAESLFRAARAAERVYAFGNAVELYERALQTLKRTAPASLARHAEALLRKEAALERLGRRSEQLGVIGEAIDIARTLGDDARLAAVYLRQAGACAYLGKHDEAAGAARQALEIYRRIADRPGEAEALRELGFVHWRAERYADALRCAREVLALHRRLGDVAGEASALHNLAEIHRGLGSPRQALEWYGQALELHWAAQNHEGEILTLFGMANALQQAGDPSASRARYEQALELSERHGERTMQSRALHALAMQAAAQGDLDAGLALMRRAVEVDRAIGYAHALGHDLLDLSRMHLLRGERLEARTALREAVVWFRYTQDQAALDLAKARLDDVEAGRGPPPSAAREWVKSHLPLGEGKVYCEFESPLAGMRRSAF